jgi:DNA-binding transcriptional LysR family regulator
MSAVQMERSGEMEVFVRVVQEGTLAGAARTLTLTPSGVSKILTRLEGRLGIRLLTRTTRALALTEEGEAYHRACVRILRELDEAEQVASEGLVRGRLRVSASIPFGSRFVAPAIPTFLERHPQVSVELSLTDQVIDLIAQRTDLAIRIGELLDSSLVARKIGESTLVVVAAPIYLAQHGTPLAPGDLQRHECLTFTFRRSRTGWPFRRGGRIVEQRVTGRLQVNSGETMRALAIAGAGIARLALFHVATDIEAGRLVPLLADHDPKERELVHAVYTGGGHAPRRVRLFIDHLAESVGRTLEPCAATVSGSLQR